jgi:hypothetical protein
VKYEPLDFVSKEHSISEIATGDVSRVTVGILAAALESDEPAWVEACAVALTLAADPAIRRAGVLALDHLIRRFPEPERRVVDTILDRLDNEDQLLSGAVGDLRDDLAVFRPDPRS